VGLLSSRLSAVANALLGVSAYQAQGASTIGAQRIDDDNVEQIRELTGGQIQPVAVTQQKWLLADLERASVAADNGDLSIVGNLWASMSRDGFINGLGETRTAGLVSLPLRWYGDEKIISELSDETESRTIFGEMCPSVELAMLAADEMVCGAGVAELVPVAGRDYPVLVRLDPSFLWYNNANGQWYYRSRAGLLLIEPGMGRWVLHTRARQSPWKKALWPALGRAFIHKEHAMLHRANFSGKLANPARVAFAPQQTTEQERVGFLSRLLAWGLNTTIELTPGWDVKLLESNGRGWEVFGKEIEQSDLEIMIALAGQVVTVTGGTGFANADIHQTIKADLIKQTADALAQTINQQVLPIYVIKQHGIEALKNMPRLEWDTAPPEDRKTSAEALKAVAGAVGELRELAAASGKCLDEDALFAKFGVPIAPGKKPLIEAPMTDREKGEQAAEAAAKAPPAGKPPGKPSSAPPPKKGKK
jgi:hypothetical protein